MPIEHPPPTPATVKYLYAHASRCAYQGCSRPLYRVDEQTGARTLNSRICHINARREGGPSIASGPALRARSASRVLALGLGDCQFTGEVSAL
jgi:hypothetical protein